MTVEVNGDTADTLITEQTAQDPYDVCVGVYIGRHDEEDGGGVYRQITLSSQGLENDYGNSVDFEVLLSVAETRAIRDNLTRVIGLALNAPDPD